MRDAMPKSIKLNSFKLNTKLFAKSATETVEKST